MSVDVDAAAVGVAAFLTALATGLGVLPFLVARSVPLPWFGLADALAAGAMLAASATLVWEGVQYGAIRTVAGAVAGTAFVLVVRRRLKRRDHLRLGPLAGAAASQAIVLIAVMTAHSVTEGVGIGVSYGGGETLGVFITAAIALHNVPEGLAIGLVLVPRGSGVARAAWWSVFSSLPQPLLAVPAFVFVEKFLWLLPIGLGFAAGAMAAMVAVELVPDARASASRRAVAATIAVAFSAMLLLQALLSLG